MNTEMDYLVINDFVYNKTEQPHWNNKEKWMVKFRWINYEKEGYIQLLVFFSHL